MSKTNKWKNSLFHYQLFFPKEIILERSESSPPCTKDYQGFSISFFMENSFKSSLQSHTHTTDYVLIILTNTNMIKIMSAIYHTPWNKNGNSGSSVGITVPESVKDLWSQRWGTSGGQELLTHQTVSICLLIFF